MDLLQHLVDVQGERFDSSAPTVTRADRLAGCLLRSLRFLSGTFSTRHFVVSTERESRAAQDERNGAAQKEAPSVPAHKALSDHCKLLQRDASLVPRDLKSQSITDNNDELVDRRVAAGSRCRCYYSSFSGRVKIFFPKLYRKGLRL